MTVTRETSPAEAALARAHALAVEWLRTLPDRAVVQRASLAELRAALGGPLPDDGEDPVAVVERLAERAEPGLVATAGPRYFGFVIGGAIPAALAADWLTSAWDQNAAMYVMGPSAAVAEEVAGAWLIDLFGLPETVSVGFTTGATMASFTGLAAGRHALLARAGWDVERAGLFGAPELPVVVGEERHATIDAVLQMLGLGWDRVIRVDSDDQGRMRPDRLRAVLEGLDRPALVCAQSGNVNTGAFDPLPPIVAAVRANDGWLHIDGAFGLWAAADPERRELVDGLAGADSWTTDAHKWLNVPYDCGLAFVADKAAHHAAMSMGAAYYVESSGAERDPFDWVPDSSRRARGFTIWAALRSLGRRGVAQLVARDCDLARRFGETLAGERDVRILNEIVLNQVLVRFDDPSGDPAAGDQRTEAVIRTVQTGGTMWLGGTTWHGRRAMRISVSGWATDAEDVDRSVAAIVEAARANPTG
jgi:glutamate/tyrosine decarboxylase-like PLP-dependent enzyme